MNDYLKIDGQQYEVRNVSTTMEADTAVIRDGLGGKQQTVATSISISGSFETDEDINTLMSTATPKPGEIRVSKGAGNDIVLQNVILAGYMTMGPNSPTRVDFVSEDMTEARRYSKLTETFK